MKKFEIEYKKMLDNIELKKEEIDLIKSNVILVKKYPKIFKIRYAVIFILLFVLFFGAVNADKIIKFYKIVTNDNKVFSESGDRSFISNAVLNKEYSKDLFLLENKYSYEDIENKLGERLLKNDLLKSDLFVLRHLETFENKISKLSFSLLNLENVEYLTSFSIMVRTKYFSKEDGLRIKGGQIYYKEYYIKKLKTEALIIYNSEEYANMVIIEFTYNNIGYEIELNGLNFKDEIQVEKIYEFLESFYINKK